MTTLHFSGRNWNAPLSNKSVHTWTPQPDPGWCECLHDACVTTSWRKSSGIHSHTQSPRSREAHKEMLQSTRDLSAERYFRDIRSPSDKWTLPGSTSSPYLGTQIPSPSLLGLVKENLWHFPNRQVAFAKYKCRRNKTSVPLFSSCSNATFYSSLVISSLVGLRLRCNGEHTPFDKH